MGENIELESRVGKGPYTPGVHAVILVLAHSAQRRREYLKKLTLELTHHTMMMMRIYAPSGQTGYIHSHINMSGLHYTPGGAGGGGSYEGVAGVRAGSSLHPIYVHQGTANQGDTEALLGVMSGGSTQGRIYPRHGRLPATVTATGRRRATWEEAKPHVNPLRNPALTFQKRGEPRKFRAWVSGQRPQPFAYFAFRHTAVYAEGRIRASAEAALINPL